MRVRGLRGSLLEEIINRTLSDYRVKKLALIQKISTPIVPIAKDKSGHITKAYFDKKSTVDYIGVVQDIAVCFDAKECENVSFLIKNIHKHQIDFMKEWEEQGGISFLLIYFKKISKVYYMRNEELEKVLKTKNKSFNASELNEKYFIDVKNKIKLDLLSKIKMDIGER